VGKLKDGFWEDSDLVGQNTQYEVSFLFAIGMDINGKLGILKTNIGYNIQQCNEMLAI
jgi:hypothetical protein